jgi:hypothetical protein
VIALTATCLAVCLGAVAFFTFASENLLEQMMVDDPVQARREARQVLEYELPFGFSEVGVMDFYTGKMVIIQSPAAPDARPGLLILITELDLQMMDVESFRAQFQEQVQQSLQGQQVDWELVDERLLTVQGREVWAYTYEGEGDDGAAMRQLATEPFPGKSGMVFLTILGAQTEWPQAEVEAFLASIQ